MRIRSRVSVVLAVAATALGAAAVVVPHIGTGGVAAAAATATQASTAATVPYTPYPSTGTELYVDNAASSNCSDSGPGTDSRPFCTIAEAASVVQPGETVVVEPGTYAGATISAQGTLQAPITFDAIEGATVNAVAGEPTFTISGAHYVELDGFSAFGSRQGFYVTDGSSGVTINGGYADTASGSIPAVEVDGTTSDVTVSRIAIEARMPVQVDAGASKAVITGNSILPDLVGTWGVLVTDAPGTDVVGNTIHAICSGGISIAGASTGVTVENNIVQPVTSGGSNACPAGTAISVSADSQANSVVDYNLIDPSAGEPLYDWGGTSYTSLADFQTASGQAKHDIAANPDLGQQTFGPSLIPGPNVFWFPLSTGSPAIDSANSTAAGELDTDQLGNPRTNDPSVVASCNATPVPPFVCFDRGAVEFEGPVTTTTGPEATSTGPLTATWSLGLNPEWTTNGGSPYIAGVNFGDGTPEEVGRPWEPVARDFAGDGTVSFQHTYTTAGRYTVHYEFSTGSGGVESGETQVVVGAAYTPVSPVRILDTRNGTGTGKAAPVAANGTLTLPIPVTDGVPAAEMSAVVMNVTVTRPTRSGNLTVYPGSGSVPTVSNLNFSADETVPNLVTVQVSDGEVSFHNNSGGTVQVVADLEGFYGPGGYGFKPLTPRRVLDTRNGTGSSVNGVSGPIAAGGVLRENLSAWLPAEATAVVMNVTVTQPKRSGYLTLYPDGATKPNASNLNFSAGETVPNLVIVPLKNRVLDIANTSGGTVQVVADLDGYFSDDDLTPDVFVPYGPTREVDTRTTHSLAAHGTYTVNILNDNPCTGCVAAMVDNVTVTQPAKAGNLIVYPAGQPRPVVSNLNFSADETVPNLTMVGGGNGQVSFYNNSPGTVQLIVDEYGYFFPGSTP
jgi:hypothetical protein